MFAASWVAAALTSLVRRASVVRLPSGRRRMVSSTVVSMMCADQQADLRLS